MSIKKGIQIFKEKYPLIYQMISFCVVGTSGLLVMLIFYYILLAFHANIQIANFAGFFMSTAYSYLLNFVFVFEAKNTHHQSAVIKFFVLYFILYLLSAYLLHLIVDFLYISKLIAPVINAILITPPSFFGSKYWVFKK